MAEWIEMALGTQVGLSPGGFVLDWDPAPSQKDGGAPSPIFSHVHCGQTAEWIKMTLDMEVGLGPRQIVRDGDSAPLPERAEPPPPNFRPIFIVAGCVKMRLGGEVGHSRATLCYMGT